MLLKSKLSPEDRKTFFSILGGAAQIALVVGLVLGQLEVPGTDFLQGMLIGFSIVGNLAFLITVSRERNSK